MKFSIITVSLNSGPKLLETVENILKQTYKDFEIIVKDGGSTDESLSKVKDLNSPFVKVVETPDKGIYDAMNEAVKYATGDYVLFLNAGDKFYSGDVLERVARLDLFEGCAYRERFRYFLQDSRGLRAFCLFLLQGS